MSASDQKIIRAEDPLFVTRENLDDLKAMSSVTFARGDLTFGRYVRRRPGYCPTGQTAQADMIMAVVMLRDCPAHTGWRNAETIHVSAQGGGSLTCFDMRDTWRTELFYPFDTFNVFIPLAAFDEIADEHCSRWLDSLSCSLGADQPDETMLGLCTALNPLLSRPAEANALFVDYVFAAMVRHLAVTYGRFSSDGIAPGLGLRRGMLSVMQERRVKGRLLGDLKGEATIAELAALTELSRSQFLRAFKQTFGMPPHRWQLAQRAKRAKELLRLKSMPIHEVAWECGFADQSHLTRVFRRFYGVGPGAWRRSCNG
jgi:AraC-like DNA-binding protein